MPALKHGDPENGHNHDDKVEHIKKAIRSYPDFPKKGILFRDFLPIFLVPQIFNDLVEILVSLVRRHGQIDAIIGLEARGFLIGPVVARELKVKFTPIRKAGKLPGHVKQLSYEKEYGSDVIEIQSGSIAANDRCIFMDDLLATGGSLSCAVELVKQCGAKPVAAVVVIELKDLNGRDIVSVPIHSVVSF